VRIVIDPDSWSFDVCEVAPDAATIVEYGTQSQPPDVPAVRRLDVERLSPA
jgi:hypothetical protein